MAEIVINGTTHKVSKDNFDVTYIDGLTVDKFLDNCSILDLEYLAKHGLKIMRDDPEYFDDIAERIEL